MTNPLLENTLALSGDLMASFTRPPWMFTRQCERASGILHPWHPKEADAMANSVDPDQTASSEAVWSWSALFAETYLSQYIEFLR